MAIGWYLKTAKNENGIKWRQISTLVQPRKVAYRKNIKWY